MHKCNPDDLTPMTAWAWEGRTYYATLTPALISQPYVLIDMFKESQHFYC